MAKKPIPRPDLHGYVSLTLAQAKKRMTTERLLKHDPNTLNEIEVSAINKYLKGHA